MNLLMSTSTGTARSWSLLKFWSPKRTNEGSLLKKISVVIAFLQSLDIHPSSAQCAAVSTKRSLIKDPPHLNSTPSRDLQPIAEKRKFQETSRQFTPILTSGMRKFSKLRLYTADNESREPDVAAFESLLGRRCRSR